MRQAGHRMAESLQHYAGALLARLLDEESVVEISLNENGAVFVKRFGQAPEPAGQITPNEAITFLRWCATQNSLFLRDDNPFLSTVVPGTAHRIEGVVPPVALAPIFSIRRHREDIPALASFGLDPQVIEDLTTLMLTKRSIVVAGGTGTGKTTFASALLARLAEVAPQERVVILEDTRELISRFENTVRLLSTPDYSLDRLLVSTLRLAPDRIMLGEVRTGAVALTLLKAWNTGHPGGLTTIHANSAEDAMIRLNVLMSEVVQNPQTHLLQSSIGAVIYLERKAQRPQAHSIATPTPNGKMETRDVTKLH